MTRTERIAHSTLEIYHPDTPRDQGACCGLGYHFGHVGSLSLGSSGS